MMSRNILRWYRHIKYELCNTVLSKWLSKNEVWGINENEHLFQYEMKIVKERCHFTFLLHRRKKKLFRILRAATTLFSIILLL